MFESTLAFVCIVAVSAVVSAQGVEDFNKGWNVDLYIGYSVGGAYDLYARVIGPQTGLWRCASLSTPPWPTRIF